LENYEEWDVTIPSIPPRSRLYRLEPIGMGTPYVESLTSYVARLAAMHCLSPKSFVMHEILPFQDQAGRTPKHYHRLNAFWQENSSSLNGVTPIAEQWVDTLQALTSCENLRCLTMLTWKSVLTAKGLLRRGKAWCSVCFEEWHQNLQAIYEPLLWTLNGINTCLYHHIPLVTLCPHCQKMLPFLTQNTRPGYCSYCAGWLGNDHGSRDGKYAVNENDELKRDHWVTEVTGDLLLAAPNLRIPPSREQFVLRIEHLLQQTNGNMSVLARLLNANDKTLWGYLHAGHIPYFDSLLRMCFALSATPLEFLGESTIAFIDKPRFTIDAVPVISRGKWKKLTEDDVRLMRQALQNVLEIDDQVGSPLNLKSLAQRMGYNIETVQKHCPDLARAIQLRYKRRWAEGDNLDKMKLALEKALTQRMSLASVAQQINCDQSTLRKYFPDLCANIVTKYRERFNSEQIEQRLQEVLLSEKEVPAICELARQMGYEPHILCQKFPDLCQQISARRRAERKRRHEKKIAGICEEIREIMLQLHQQKTYPSARQVATLLSNPIEIRTKEVHDFWVKMLEELGYPTDTFKRYV
jgi:hypothetical protein